MSTIQRPRIALANIFFCLFAFIAFTSVLFAYDVGFEDIASTFLYLSPPSPPPSSYSSSVFDSTYHHHGDHAVLDDLKVPACIALFIFTLLAFLYIRNTYSRRFAASCYEALDHCVAQARITLLLQHNELLASGLQKATNDLQQANANVKKEQQMSKWNREMVEAACKKYVELDGVSAEALRRSNDKLDESKEKVARLNALVNDLRQKLEQKSTETIDLKHSLELSQANVRRLTHSAQEHEQEIEAADRNRLKAIAKARHAQAEANAVRSEAASARLELDATRVKIGLVQRDLGASKRRAKAAREGARFSHAENVSLRSALETLTAELKEQKADNKKLNRLLAAYNWEVPATSPPLTPPGSVTPPEEVTFATSPDPGATSFPKFRRFRLGLRLR